MTGPTDITLTRQGTTLIYVDTSKQPAYDWVYWLAMPPADPPPTMTLAEAWAPNRGYLLFIDTAPADWTTLETDVAATLDPDPRHTGFGWIRTARVTGAWVATVSPDATIAADVLISPPGLPCLDIKAGTPVSLAATGPSGGRPVIALSHPSIPPHGRQPAADPPSAPGVVIELTGSHAGAARFQLLRGFAGAAGAEVGTGVVKPIFDAVFDPLRPTRTSFTYTGIDIILRDVDGAFSIAAS